MNDIFHKTFSDHFQHVKTDDQDASHNGFLKFLQDKDQLFVLKGYAGTGKTSLVAAWVQALKAINRSVILLAPTGRAAKVFSFFAKTDAFTIHKRIYQPVSGPGGKIHFQLALNKLKNAVIFVDEASMITSRSGVALNSFADRNLLDDLFSFVAQGVNCKIVFIGDDFQLPPVMMDQSPALDMEELNVKVNGKIHHFHLSQVIRQAKESGILYNANELRKNPEEQPKMSIKNFEDIEVISGSQLHEKIEDIYAQYGEDNALVITRSNKMANLYNQQIRYKILWQEETLSQGDRLMVVRNNYFWIEKDDPFGFIANGDTVILKRILKTYNLYGYEFVSAIVQMVDFQDSPEKEVLVLKAALETEGPSLPREALKKLFFEIEKDFPDIHNKKKRYDEIMKTSHFNALQMKFAYAVTCHKSQGGQWPVVFIDMGFTPEGITQYEQNRWLYTAITRAEEKVFLVNFPEEYFLEGHFQTDW